MYKFNGLIGLSAAAGFSALPIYTDTIMCLNNSAGGSLKEILGEPIAYFLLGSQSLNIVYQLYDIVATYIEYGAVGLNTIDIMFNAAEIISAAQDILRITI